MGLAERRSADRLKKDDYPALESRIDEAAEFDVQIDVAWEALAIDGCARQLRRVLPGGVLRTAGQRAQCL